MPEVMQPPFAFSVKTRPCTRAAQGCVDDYFHLYQACMALMPPHCAIPGETAGQAGCNAGRCARECAEIGQFLQQSGAGPALAAHTRPGSSPGRRCGLAKGDSLIFWARSSLGSDSRRSIVCALCKMMQFS